MAQENILKVISIYRITNLLNDKVYIGQSVDYQQRWRQHKMESKKDKPSMVINCAMKKHGIDNFIFEIIASCKTQEDANETETELVKQYESHISTGKGYNVSNGGSNAPKTEEWKKKVSASLMGHAVSEETIKKLSESHKGHKHTEISKRKIGQASAARPRQRGLKPWNKNVSMSEERKQKMRKLTQEQELAILNDTRSSRVLAKEYGVNKSTILDIRNRHKGDSI